MTAASSARLLSAMHRLPASLANTLKGSGFLDAAHIRAPGAGSPKKGWQWLSALRAAEGVQNSVKGSRKQQPKSRFGCGAYLGPRAPGAQKGWHVLYAVQRQRESKTASKAA